MDRVKFRGFVFTAELDLLGGGFGVDFMLLQSRECMTFVNIIINYKKHCRLRNGHVLSLKLGYK